MQERRKRRNPTTLLVALILLLLPLATSRVLELVRGEPVSKLTPAAAPILAPQAALSPSILPSRIPSAEAPGAPGTASLEELARAERAEWNTLLARQQARRAHQGGEQGWIAIAPRASNPSRFFPEYPHPTLHSGVRLETTRTEPEPERAPASIIALPAAPALAPLPAPPPAPSPTPPTPPAPAAVVAPKSRPIRGRVTEIERFVKVCGKPVPEARLAEALAECEAHSTPPPADDGNNQTLLRPQ